MSLRTACVLVVLALPMRLSAQRLSDIGFGDRVRLETHAGGLLQGQAVDMRGDSVRVRPDGGTTVVVVATTAVRRFSVVDGRDRRRGARVGATVGGVLGLGLLGAALYADHRGTNLGSSALLYATPAAALLTVGGFALGVVAAPERWSPPRPVRMVRNANAAGVQLSVQF